MPLDDIITLSTDACFPPFKVVDGLLNVAISDTPIRADLLAIADMSNFYSYVEVMATVCHPKPKRALFNIIRPFG